MSLSSTLRLALAGALLSLLLAACGGGTTTVIETVTEGETSSAPEAGTESTGEAPGPRGAEEAEPGGVRAGGDESAKAAAGGLEGFQSPSGNIGCYVGPEGARCDIAEREWSAPRPQGCPSQVDSGQGLEVGQRGPAQVVCAGDTALNPEARVLAYGEEIHAGDFTCHSRQDGVECLDDGDGRGFFISKQGYRLF